MSSRLRREKIHVHKLPRQTPRGSRRRLFSPHAHSQSAAHHEWMPCPPHKKNSTQKNSHSFRKKQDSGQRRPLPAKSKPSPTDSLHDRVTGMFFCGAYHLFGKGPEVKGERADRITKSKSTTSKDSYKKSRSILRCSSLLRHSGGKQEAGRQAGDQARQGNNSRFKSSCFFSLEPHAHGHVVVVFTLDHEGLGAAEQPVVRETADADRVHAGGGLLGDLHVVVAG